MKIRLGCLALLVLLLTWSVPAAQPPAKPGQPVIKADARDLVFLGGSRPLLIRLDIRMHGKPLQAAWQEFIDYVFKYADTDGDGVLSKEEAEGAPQPMSLLNSFAFGGFRGQGSNGKMDANGDGKVTRAEFADYYRQSGLPPFQIHLEEAKNPGGRFMQVGKKAPPTGQLNAALLKHLDTDKDGKLSRQELAAAERALSKLDTNEDEIITPKELLPDYSPLSGGFESVYMGMQSPRTSTGNETLFLAADLPPREVARRLLVRYGGAKAKKALSRADLNLDDVTFAALDRDGNGELDAEELAHFVGRPPDLDFLVRVGERTARATAVEIAPSKGGNALFSKALPAGDSLALVLGGNRLTLRVGEAPARSQLGFIIREQFRQQFQQADKDNNGYIDEKEARTSTFQGPIFKAMDRDGDGKVYEKEMLAYLDTVEDMQTRATTSSVSLTFADSGRSLFDLFDADRDGRLSVRELKRLPQLVDELGRDGAGAISMAEIPHSYLFKLEQGAGGGGANPYAIFEAMGMNQERPAPTTRGPVWFQKMDRNRDGDVSRREFLGSDALFRRIDTDGDGLISSEEALRFEEILKQSKQPAQ